VEKRISGNGGRASVQACEIGSPFLAEWAKGEQRRNDGLMKWRQMRIFAAAGLVLAGGEAAASPSAREALQVLEGAQGSQAITNVVGIVGFNGDDQPDAWRLLVRDPANADVLQEYVIAGGKLTGRNEIRRADHADLPDKPLLGATLRVDSTEAYRIADDEAILAGISFERLHYQLRFRGADPAPTWLLTFVDATGGEIGQVVIDSSDSSIPFRHFPSALAATPAAGTAPEVSAVAPEPAPSGRSDYSSRPGRLRNFFSGSEASEGPGRVE